jgi:hypothetical protein
MMPTMAQRIDNVELFQVGTHRGKPWSESDLSAMVRNAGVCADRFHPPAVIGHEEYQPLTREFAESEAVSSAPELFNTGTPKLGEIVPETLRVEMRNIGGKELPTLVGSVDGLPDAVYDAVKAGAYDRVSAEVYPEPPEGYEHLEGPILRRVAFLGGQLPHIKTLSNLQDVLAGKRTEFKEPPAKTIVAMSERRLTPAREFRDQSGRLLAVFSEVQPMAETVNAFTRKPLAKCSEAAQSGYKKFADGPDAMGGITRDELLAILTDAGMDISLIGPEVTDAVLTEMARMARMFIEDEASANAEAEMATAAKEGTEDGLDAAKMGDEKPAETAETETPAPTDEDKNKPAKMSETPATTPDIDVMIAAAVAKAMAPMVSKFSEAERIVADLGNKTATARRAELELFCEQLRRDGKLLPAELDGGTLIDLLATVDSMTGSAVAKFSDGQTATILDRFKSVLSARPKLALFADKIKSKQDGGASAEAEVLKFAEDNRAVFAKNGRTPQQVVEIFRKTRETNPGLTPAEYLGQPTA